MENTTEKQRIKAFKPTTQSKFYKKIYGFDVETYGNKNNFLCASVVGENGESWYFEDKNELISFLLSWRFRDAFIVASSLVFDFQAVFRRTEHEKHFDVMYRGSRLMMAKAKTKEKYKRSVTFIDTMNFTPMSVSKLGKIIGLEKLPKPKAFGRIPINQEEWTEMREYNERDAMISLRFYRFFLNSIQKLGGTPEITIGSTAIKMLRNRYLKNIYYVHDEEILKEQFQGYYGGRVEAIQRGYFENVNYYDINSLYPSVMANNQFPNPNTLTVTEENSVYYIMKYEGMSHVKVSCSGLYYPYLSYRTDDKLLFANGTFTGWWTHFELRNALKLGYVIHTVYKTHYYTETCNPFKEMVTDLYALRLQFKKENNPMEQIVKLILNSTYGKFGQKFIDREQFCHGDYLPNTVEDVTMYPESDYFSYKEDVEPALFCFPIWASYITAYARNELYTYIIKYNPIYYDTDSIMTRDTIPVSSELGKMKLEKRWKKLIVIRPKFYIGLDDTGKVSQCIKGVPFMNISDFNDWVKKIERPIFHFEKILTVKDALRRRKLPLEVIQMTKELALEDKKRRWNSAFQYKNIEKSNPLFVSEK